MKCRATRPIGRRHEIAFQSLAGATDPSETSAPRSGSTRPTGGRARAPRRRRDRGRARDRLRRLAHPAGAPTASAPAQSAAGVIGRIGGTAPRHFPTETGHPVYWAGRRARPHLRADPAHGRKRLRPLPAARRARSAPQRPDFLTIGTYPRPRALKGLRDGSRGSRRAVLVRRARTVASPSTAGTGRAACTSRSRAADVQVEVYDPSRREGPPARPQRAGAPDRIAGPPAPRPDTRREAP